MKKVCCICKIEKSLNEFYKDERTKDGLYRSCKLCHQAYNKNWRLNNIEDIRKYKKQWKIDNPEYHREYNKVYQNKKLKSDPVFRLLEYFKSRTYHALKNNWKIGHTIELIGKTGYELMNYFESMFYANMTRENYGKVWHVDHIKPCSSFDLSKPEEQRKCFHYSNLQPLLIKDNLEKYNKLNWKL